MRMGSNTKMKMSQLPDDQIVDLELGQGAFDQDHQILGPGFLDQLQTSVDFGHEFEVVLNTLDKGKGIDYSYSISVDAPIADEDSVDIEVAEGSVDEESNNSSQGYLDDLYKSDGIQTNADQTQHLVSQEQTDTTVIMNLTHTDDLAFEGGAFDQDNQLLDDNMSDKLRKIEEVEVKEISSRSGCEGEKDGTVTMTTEMTWSDLLAKAIPTDNGENEEACPEYKGESSKHEYETETAIISQEPGVGTGSSEELQQLESLLKRVVPASKPASKVPSNAQSQALLQCSQGAFPEVWYKFKRFETLSLLNLYHYQHDLVELEGKIAAVQGVITQTDRQLLRELLKEYHEAISRFKDISVTKRPKLSHRQATVDILSRELQDSHYSDAPDALALLDLIPQSLGVEPDSLRLLLHQIRPEPDEADQQQYENRTPGMTEKEKLKQLFEGRPNAIMISSKIDSIARVLSAILAGAFLLAPMAALSYIDSKVHCLLTTCLFVLVFAIVLSLASRASNQEVITATATYAAVLVVFVGQTSTSYPSPNSGT